MKRSAFFIELLIFVVLFSSCDSKRKQMIQNINKAWTLIERASKQPETDLAVPMGFVLGCTDEEFEVHCADLIKQNGGRDEGSVIYINSKEFGGVEREVRLQKFNYFSDPNTETPYVSQIEFIFDEFRYNGRSNGGWGVLCDYISKKFDESWEMVEFNLKDADEEISTGDYYRYWIRGNMAVELYREGFWGFICLTFYNVPKTDTKFLRDKVNMELQINEDVKKNREEIENRPQIVNSAWDGSVWQVKNYLKKNLKDPDSYESIEWGKVIKEGKEYKVRHKYRAKNSFGGYVIEEWIFTIDESGNVIYTLQL